ncbi:MAG: hypothetical protein U9R20_05340 [Thermodesulfobacteriota bacterium]|nr:hypothetical protein [Thermodesulfobacteriota bacterium]
MDFQKHTSSEMVELFNKKPFQGQSPENAKVVFLSSDANYSPEISNHDFFKYILDYQKDGVAFWEKYNCHHPFLLPNYPFNKNMTGVPFHRNFSKIGLVAEQAKYISFLELLDIPTIGNKSQNKNLFYELISLRHLEYIERLMLNDTNKLFFVSNGVLKDIAKLKKIYPVFQWLEFEKTSNTQYSKSIRSNKIKEVYHFSAYQIHSQIEEISLEINNWLKQNC